MTEATNLAFSYTAQSAIGEPVSGTIDAPTHGDAMNQLDGLGLRVLEIAPVVKTAKPDRLTSNDFLLFNQQLAMLTKAGLPIEQGLRLIAEDMRSSRLASAIRKVAGELDRGTPLGDAFERYRGYFPEYYGRLMDAGVRTNNLPGILLGMGRHLEMVNRLKTVLWRAMAYPISVGIALVGVMAFMGYTVVPQMRAVYDDFGIRLPQLTQFVLWVAEHTTLLTLIGLTIVLFIPVMLRAIYLTSGGRAFAEAITIRLPFIGRAVRAAATARWCNSMQIAINGGLDLPRAIELAGQTTGSPRIAKDGDNLRAALAMGHRLDRAPTVLLPAAVPAAIEVASEHGDLPSALELLSGIYDGQANMRIAMLPSILGPMLVFLIASMIGFIVAALAIPFLSILNAMTG